MRERRQAGPLTREVWDSRSGAWYVADPNTGCHVWARSNNGRYGNVAFMGHVALAHRVAWSLFRGPIDAGLTIDHLCRKPLCVNPDHMRAVSQRENVLADHSMSPSAVNARKTQCPAGHSLSGDNALRHGPKRKCRECHNARRRIKRIERPRAE